MRNCPFQRVNKPKAPEFKVVKIGECLSAHSGFVNATWEDVESNMQAVKNAVKHIHWGIVKVENGSFDGPGYNNRHRKEDTRDLGHKLLVKKDAGEFFAERINRCTRRIPHIIKKVSEGLKNLNESQKANEEQIKNSDLETETKETEIIEEIEIPQTQPEQEEKLVDKVLEEKIEENQTEEEKKPDLNSFITELNGFSAQGDMKKVEETLKSTFSDEGNAKNIFSEMFSSGDKFGQAVKGFFDFVGNCKNNKEKIQQHCEDIKNQQEESLNTEDNITMPEQEPVIPGQFEENVKPDSDNQYELSIIDLEKVQYLAEMFPQYPENLMKSLVSQHPQKSLSDLIDLIVAEQFY